MLTRRDTILAAAASVFAPPGRAEGNLLPTPAQIEGPFYPNRMPPETDPDLVRMAGQARQAGGELLALSGQILDRNGAPIENALVEIWQVDANGCYIHTSDARRGRNDPAFQGFGRTKVDAEGRYAFRTVRPVPYDDRTPHVHYKVYRPNGRVLTTQLMIAGEPMNERDFVFRRLRKDQQQRCLAEFRRQEAGWVAQWDVVLG